jgi:hypothetical protein
MKIRDRTGRKQRQHNWKKYGIKNRNGTQFTRDDYVILFAFQNGSCALCGKHQSELRYSLAADHHHDTGRVRGLLCQNCNWKVSVVEDKEFMEKCRRYIE